MTAHSYLRPVGRITGPYDRPTDRDAAQVVPIGDSGNIAFAALELIDRHGDLRVERRLVDAVEATSEVARGGVRAAQLRAALDGFAAPRAPLAGIPLDRPRIMGIVNVTPDSFSDGGNHADAGAAIAFAERLVEEGAEFLDVGGESTRPGSDPVALDEELRRVMPVVEGLLARLPARVSVDTRKAEVMRRAAAAGVHLLNDVSALQHDPLALEVVADTGLPIVLMHALGDPKTMQQCPRYDDVLLDVYDALERRIEACLRAGIARDRIVIDPGIGFGKTLEHNLQLLAGLALLHGLGAPVLLGASRKRTIGRLTGTTDPAERVHGSVAAALAGAMQGASILRVHDVAATRQALAVWDAACRGDADGTIG
ncbi:MAG: dihydropteroate synthase [Hyphomicrobiaceae bacterium]